LGKEEFYFYVILAILPQGSHDNPKKSLSIHHRKPAIGKSNVIFTKGCSHFEIPLFIIHSFYFTVLSLKGFIEFEGTASFVRHFEEVRWIKKRWKYTE
jgi:hypothetical protein